MIAEQTREEDSMASKPKEDVAVAASADPKVVIEAFRVVGAALEALNKEERARVLGAVAILFGIEEQTRYVCQHD